MTEAESEVIRISIRQDRPYGTESWTRSTTAQLGLQSSLREDYPPLIPPPIGGNRLTRGPKEK